MYKAEVLVADIGSTLTKLSAFACLEAGAPHAARFLGQGVALTSLYAGTVVTGLEAAREDLRVNHGVTSAGAMLMASSSAAGGLRMSVHGLTEAMTLRAAREASLGAGAIVVFSSAGLLYTDDLERIQRISPNLILLAGGVDYGERKAVEHNARALAGLKPAAPVIYAGNKTARARVERILQRAGVTVFSVDNVYPRIDELNIDPVRACIRQVFAHHIITAPGMKQIKARVSGEVVPTPAAVMQATELLAATLGDVLTVDVGGATTDVHSVTSGSARYTRLMTGPEPLAKRTVEGDLGVYINAAGIAAAAKIPTLDTAALMALPDNPEARRLAIELTRRAVEVAIRRHAGEVRRVYDSYGSGERVDGRDLSAVKFIIGTGGALTRLGEGEAILHGIRADSNGRKLLPPDNVQILLDRHYIMAAAGVLSQRYSEQARRLLLDSLALGSVEHSHE